MSAIAQGRADVTIATTHADVPAVVDANAALLGPSELYDSVPG